LKPFASGEIFFVCQNRTHYGETERQTERESGRKTENEESGRQAEREESMYCGRVKARRFAAWRPPFPFPTTAIPTLSPHIVFLYAYARPVGRQREAGRQGGRERRLSLVGSFRASYDDVEEVRGGE